MPSMMDAWLRASLMTASLLVEQGLEEAPVGVEAGRSRGMASSMPTNARAVRSSVSWRVLRAADEAHAREAEAVPVEGAARGLEDARVRAQAEVVVRAEVEDGLRALADE
jgi:hypothetical protein